jgi:hypothetical protein
MQAALVEAVGDRAAVEEALAELGTDPTAIEEACLAILSVDWENPQQRALIEDAAAEAKNRMPVTEVTVLALVGLYSMWLVVTGGRKKASRVTKRDSKGNLEEHEVIEWYPFSQPLAAMYRLFAPNESNPNADQ